MIKSSNCNKQHDLWVYFMRFGNCLGCHQRPNRSFFYKNRQFPICARCTGVIIGQILAIITYLLSIRLNIIWCVILCGIMFCDWLIQKLSILESTNPRRLITGVLGGYGYATIFCKILMYILYSIFKVINQIH